MTPHPIAEWHRIVREHDARALVALVDEDAVFHSPVAHTPQRGRRIVLAYLGAALQVFVTPGFRYVRQIVGDGEAALEFEVEIDGVHVNGVDLVRWNGEGRIVDFKVFVRPLKAINLVHQRMAEMLSKRTE